MNKKFLIILGIVFVVIASIMAVMMLKKEDDSKIIMVTEAGFEPYEFYEGEKITGVDVEVAQVIANKLGKTLEIKDVDFDSVINEVKTGKADFAAAGLSITEERLKEVDFSIEYTTSKQVIVVKKGSVIKGEEDLNGKKVGVQLGTVADLAISDEYPEVELVQHKKYLLAVEDLLAGKVDAIVLDSLPAEQIVKNNEGLEILEKELFTDKYGIAVKKGNNELLKVINEVLQSLMEQGKIEEYTLKYLGD